MITDPNLRRTAVYSTSARASRTADYTARLSSQFVNLKPLLSVTAIFSSIVTDHALSPRALLNEATIVDPACD